jgi:uncharacterized membrane protein YedE/YeeE
MEYWPWWFGSVALALITVGFWYVLRRPLGVSGSWTAVLSWREARELRNAERAMRRDPADANDALMAATIAQFGTEAAYQVMSGAARATSAPTPVTARRRTSIPWTAHLAFLVAMLAGGLFVAAVRGDFSLHRDMGATYVHLFGTGLGAYLTLLAGGIAVGFGTQMGGGCTSGHGLSGCARLVPASLIATAAFFATAVAASFVLEVIAR